jgi:hypothetical protein
MSSPTIAVDHHGDGEQQAQSELPSERRRVIGVIMMTVVAGVVGVMPMNGRPGVARGHSVIVNRGVTHHGCSALP